ncbi:MAG TPA: VWA domain-containing protein [Pyrinomonadaceae bacterium]|nr:VWA domain-containing protein [Pyrinomonadaceae bacterium]
MKEKHDNSSTITGSPDVPEESFFESEISERLRSVKNPTERRTIAGLLRQISSLPLDQTRAALETSAAIAAVSIRASIEFLRATPAVAQVLEPAELRAWGELGRRLTMTDVESGVSFFISGVEDLAKVPPLARPFVFQVCARQMILSATTASETFRSAPALAEKVPNPELLRSIYEVAATISRRSAKHSAEFLNVTPAVVASLNSYQTFRGGPAKSTSLAGGSPPLNDQLTNAAIDLVSAFAEHAGGIAADAWASLPDAIDRLSAEQSLHLMKRAMNFLERGGAAALHLMVAGGEVLRALPECFDDWLELLWTIAPHGNAALVAFIRSSPSFFQTIALTKDSSGAADLARRVLTLTREVGRVDSESALACLRSSAKALQTVSIDQFESWARAGLIASDTRARRSYYALETRSSNEALRVGEAGVSLESVQALLRLYVEGLTGRAVEIAALAAVPVETRIADGRTIHLPSVVAEFGDEELDFRLYKVLAAHAAGQIEFGTYERDSEDLRASYASLAEFYDPANQDERDAFAIDRDLLAETEPHPKAERRKAPQSDLDFRQVLNLFPIPALARRIFGTIENGRIDRSLRRTYRGLTRDLDLIREHLRNRRPKIIDLPPALVSFELLFQVTLLGGALDDARDFYRQVVSELETIVADYLSNQQASVADSLMATSRVYTLFQSIAMDESEQQVEVPDQLDQEDENSAAEQMLAERETDRQPQRRDARELFNAWNSESEGEFDELDGSEAWTDGESPEQDLEAGEVAFNYDEWDRELVDHRVSWCRVIEKKVKRGSREFVDDTRERYKGVVSSIRHQFQLMKPENLARITNELDGEDYDLNAVVDFFIDRRADGQQSERIYTKRLRRQRDVAVSFLLDQSSSTARTIGRHPLQPYTHPGRRIIEIEKEGLVLMSEALEAVGDAYSINGFTSEGRRNVKFYVLKDFKEHYSDEVMRRIGGITYQNNTRLGAAIRHATAKLEKQEARTRLLIVLSDGRPYDHDYGDARYAREDTREALRQAKVAGITPFCITIDRESESELRDLYGDIGYTIIDDVMTLPERLPGIYRRLTT